MAAAHKKRPSINKEDDEWGGLQEQVTLYL